MSEENPIVFFDGVCNLCNSAVDWIVSRDKKARFRFSSLQGETAKRVLPAEDHTSLASIVLFKNGQLYRRSSAVAEILAELGGLWSVLAAGMRIVPSPLRDFIYGAIAKSRYQVFGKRDSCRLPTPAERARFLD